MTSGHAKRRLSQIGTSGVFAWYKPNTQNIWNPELWFEPSSTASSSLNSRPYDHRCDHSLNPIGISEFTTSRFLCKCSWSFNLQNPEKVYRMESSSLEPCPRDLVMLPRNIPSSTSDFAIRGNRDVAPKSGPSNSWLWHLSPDHPISNVPEWFRDSVDFESSLFTTLLRLSLETPMTSKSSPCALHNERSWILSGFCNPQLRACCSPTPKTKVRSPPFCARS